MLAHYAKTPEHFGPFRISSPDGEFLGLLGGDVADSADSANLAEGRYEIWYFVARPYWRRGVARNAVATLLSLMWASGRVARIEAEAAIENPASWTLLEKMGFARARPIPSPQGAHGKAFERYLYVLSKVE